MSILELILDDNTIAGLALICAVGYGVAWYMGWVPAPHIPALI